MARSGPTRASSNGKPSSGAAPHLDVRLPQNDLDRALGGAYMAFNAPFTISVYLLRPNGGALLHETHPVQIELVDEQNNVHAAGAGSCVDVQGLDDGAEKLTLRDGEGQFSVTIHDDDRIKGQLVYLRACIVRGGGVGNGFGVLSALQAATTTAGSAASTRMEGRSPEFRLVDHVLTVLEEPETTWYKDEGGKGAHMSVRVHCRGPGASRSGAGGAGAGLAGVPLRMDLRYESGLAVQDQSILMPLPQFSADGTADASEASFETDKHGCANVCFKITEVSKSHRQQLFRVLLRADTSRDPRLARVAPTLTCPVLVLSKKKSKPLGSGGSGSRRGRAATVAPAARASRVSAAAAVAVATPAQSELLVRCVAVLSELQWQFVGLAVDAAGQPLARQRLMRCPLCNVCRLDASAGGAYANAPAHAADCELFGLLGDCGRAGAITPTEPQRDGGRRVGRKAGRCGSSATAQRDDDEYTGDSDDDDDQDDDDSGIGKNDEPFAPRGAGAGGRGGGGGGSSRTTPATRVSARKRLKRNYADVADDDDAEEVEEDEQNGAGGADDTSVEAPKVTTTLATTVPAVPACFRTAFPPAATIPAGVNTFSAAAFPTAGSAATIPVNGCSGGGAFTPYIAPPAPLTSRGRSVLVEPEPLATRETTGEMLDCLFDGPTFPFDFPPSSEPVSCQDHATTERMNKAWASNISTRAPSPIFG